MPERREQQLLLGYIEGDLNEVERRDVLRLLEQDPKLALLMEGMVADRKLLSGLGDPEPPSWLMDEVDRHLERAMLVDVAPFESRNVAQQKRHIMYRLMVGGGVAAMVGGVASIIYLSVSGMDAGMAISSLLKMNEEPEVVEVAVVLDTGGEVEVEVVERGVGEAKEGVDEVVVESVVEPVVAAVVEVADVVVEEGAIGQSEMAKSAGGGVEEAVVSGAPVLKLRSRGLIASNMPAAVSVANVPTPSLMGDEDVAVVEAAGVYAGNSILDSDRASNKVEVARLEMPTTPATVSSLIDQMLKPVAVEGVVEGGVEVEKTPVAISTPTVQEMAEKLAGQVAQQRQDDQIQKLVDDPTLAEDFELRVVSDDLRAARAWVTEVTSLEGGTEEVAKVSYPSSKPSRFMKVRVSAKSLGKVIREIESNEAVMEVELVEREVFALGQLPGRGRLKASKQEVEVEDRIEPWPSMSPDYSELLLGQLPSVENGFEVRSQGDVGSLVELSVMIVKPVGGVGGVDAVTEESTKGPEAPGRSIENSSETAPLLPTRAPVLKLRLTPLIKTPANADTPGVGEDSPPPSPRLDLQNRSLINSKPFESLPPSTPE